MKTLMMLLFSLSLFAGNIEKYCKNKPSLKPKSFQKIKSKISKVLNKAANNKLIAAQADQTISKLISSKSPVLIRWIEERNLSYDKPEELIYAWREYYFTKLVIGNFQKQNDEVKHFVDKTLNDVRKIAFTKKVEKRISRVFTWAKRDARYYIRHSSLDKEAKEKSVKRINDIQLHWFGEFKGSAYENKLLEFLEWTFAYDPSVNKVNVGINGLKYRKDENMYAILLHEIGHSIDPCRWNHFIKGNNPFSKVQSCLRKTTGAKEMDFTLIESRYGQVKEIKKYLDEIKKNPTCNMNLSLNLGEQKDQLAETFADWFSAEVMAKSKVKLIYPRNDLCHKDENFQGSSYLSNHDRLEKVYLANPILLRKLKKKKYQAYDYCSL